MGDPLPEHFDVAITDTSLVSSILAAALSKAGKRVLHLDRHEYYGSQDAAFNLGELLAWADRPDGGIFASVSASTTFDRLPAALQAQHRKFAIALRPVLVPATSPFIDALIASGVSNYAGFRLLESLALATPHALKPLPSAKEAIFKNSDLSLIEKRRLMKCLQFATSEFQQDPALDRYPTIGALLEEHFKLTGSLLDATLYGVMGCQSPKEQSASALKRLAKYLVSTGRYGTSPFLVAQYGGISEILQGFCRVSAVHGGLYVLGKDLSITKSDSSFQITLDTPQESLQFKADLVIDRGDVQPNSPTVAQAIIVSTAPIRLESLAKAAVRYADLEVPVEEQQKQFQQAESCLVILPPAESSEHPVTCVMHGEGLFSSPSGYYVFYLSTLNPSKSPPALVLAPALATLRTHIQTQTDPFEFSMYFNAQWDRTAYPIQPAAASAGSPPTGSATEIADGALEEATSLFHRIMGDSSLDLFPPAEAAPE